MVGVDHDLGNEAHTSILLHVRHTNPTSGNTSDAGATAYCTPQSLRWNTNVNNFVSDTNAGFLEGSEWNGNTAGRFGTVLPISGQTAGASGSYGGWAEHSAGGSTYGGNSGGNGFKWDDSHSQNYIKTATQGIKIKHLPCKIYFNGNDGLKIDGVQLGEIKDLVLCGPGFADGGTAAIPTIKTGVQEYYGHA